MNIKAYLAKIGAKGGKAKSKAKTAAARKANAARWRNHKPKRVTMTPNDGAMPRRQTEKNMKNPKLKACPFCGSQPESKEIIYTGFPIFQWEVKCQQCRCATAHSYKTQKDAEMKWNVRAGDLQPVTPETVGVKALASATGSASPSKKPVRKKGVLMPADNSFEAINRFVNCLPSPEYEELQWALIGLAASREKELKAK